jgi:acyl-CoA thioesterase II
MKHVTELLKLLSLEKIEENLFRGESTSIGSKRVFGGQVLAQALQAAYQTVPEDRFVHSLHAYFVLPGDIEKPIVFDVENIRDGGSFTTRRVKAIQKGKPIFFMSTSFHAEEEGFEHQTEAKSVEGPEQLVSWKELAEKFGAYLPEGLRKFLSYEHPFIFKPVELINPLANEKLPPFRNVWMKTQGDMPEDRRLNEAVLAYASDYNLLTTAMLPHGNVVFTKNMQMASLDHAMWFHRPFKADEWLLYAIESPSANGARGFTRGHIFNQEGILVASVAQEGLIRPIQ